MKHLEEYPGIWGRGAILKVPTMGWSSQPLCWRKRAQSCRIGSESKEELCAIHSFIPVLSPDWWDPLVLVPGRWEHGWWLGGRGGGVRNPGEGPAPGPALDPGTDAEGCCWGLSLAPSSFSHPSDCALWTTVLQSGSNLKQNHEEQTRLSMFSTKQPWIQSAQQRRQKDLNLMVVKVFA